MLLITNMKEMLLTSLTVKVRPSTVSVIIEADIILVAITHEAIIPTCKCYSVVRPYPTRTVGLLC